MRRYISSLLGLVLVFGFLFAAMRRACAQGQGATATLTGQVIDQSGAAIPNVQLTLVATGGGQPVNTASNAAGYYRFSFVRPDTYTLTATIKGFADVSIPNINLQVNGTSNIDVTMRPGTV